MLRPGFPRLSHPEVAHAIPSVGFMAQVYRRVRLLVSPTIVGVQLTDQQRTAQAPVIGIGAIDGMYANDDAPFCLAHSTAYPSASAFSRTRVSRVTTTINGGGSPSNSVVAKCTASSVRIGSIGNGLRTRARTASVTPTR